MSHFLLYHIYLAALLTLQAFAHKDPIKRQYFIPSKDFLGWCEDSRNELKSDCVASVL